MNLETAVRAHAEWKLKLKMAIARRETIDVVKLSADNCCDLGRWLHGDARRLLGADPIHGECIRRHATFHCEAGKIGRAINEGFMEQANAMLAAGTPFDHASAAVRDVLVRMQRQFANAA